MRKIVKWTQKLRQASTKFDMDDVIQWDMTTEVYGCIPTTYPQRKDECNEIKIKAYFSICFVIKYCINYSIFHEFYVYEK